jgi:hypothetical protein
MLRMFFFFSEEKINSSLSSFQPYFFQYQKLSSSIKNPHSQDLGYKGALECWSTGVLEKGKLEISS